LIATAANIGAQDIVIRSYRGAFSISASVALGTGVGLIVKYLLDKRYIFRFKPRNALDDGYTFTLYVLMGVVTTVIFWSFEAGFQYAFHTKELRYLGGVIGLVVGYVAKYRLDKRYVFREEGG
jgi:hypothetical protein